MLHLYERMLMLSVQELAQITDQYVVSDLRTADLRAGHWIDDDPSLATILRWIQTHPS